MANIEKMQAELQRLQEKEKIWKNRVDRKKARIRSAQRSKNDKERTHRLIEKGAILEDIQAVNSAGIRKVPKVPRVSKNDDPEGAAKYQAYKKYVHQKNVFSGQTSPADSQEWLETLVDFSKWASKITFPLKNGQKENAWDRYMRIRNQNNQRS